MSQSQDNKNSEKKMVVLSDIIEEVSQEYPELPKEQIKATTKKFLEKIVNYLIEPNNEVTLYRFGRFQTGERTCYSANTNKYYKSLSVRFRISNKIRKEINGRG